MSEQEIRIEPYPFNVEEKINEIWDLLQDQITFEGPTVLDMYPNWSYINSFYFPIYPNSSMQMIGTIEIRGGALYITLRDPYGSPLFIKRVKLISTYETPPEN